jgi:hypothetical protein
MPSVKGAEGKAAQRARNKKAGTTTRSGSSGAAKRVSDYPVVAWEEIEADVTHLADIAGKMTHSQVGSAGQMIATLSVPLEFAHALLDTHLLARDGLVYIRMYHVSLEDYLGPMPCEACNGDGVVEDFDNDGGVIACPECTDDDDDV